MVAKSLSGGELYFVGEKDPKTGQDTSFVKIGIVRDNDARGTDHRVKEHQTGNPRRLHVVKVISTPVVERIETILHGMYAPHRLSGEWFSFDAEKRNAAIASASLLAKQAKRAADAINQAEALKKSVSKQQSILPLTQHKKLHSSIVALRSQVSACKDLSASITSLIEELNTAGVDCSRFLTIQEKKAVERFDEKAFKEKYAKIWERYQVESEGFSGVFRVIDPKAQRPDPFVLNEELAVLTKRIQKLIGLSQEKHTAVDKLHGAYLDLLAEQAPLDWELMLAEDHAKSLLGEASEIEGLFSWKREVTMKISLDKDALKQNEPKKFDEFVSLVKTKPAVIVAKDRGYLL